MPVRCPHILRATKPPLLRGAYLVLRAMRRIHQCQRGVLTEEPAQSAGRATAVPESCCESKRQVRASTASRGRRSRCLPGSQGHRAQPLLASPRSAADPRFLLGTSGSSGTSAKYSPE